jgi:Spy/CpxP family protein refolding chaperone
LRDTSLPRRSERRAASVEDLRALSAALKADPFDAAAVQAVFARQTDRMTDRARTVQTMLATRFAAMPLPERQALAARLDRALADARLGDDDDHGDDDDDD